MKKTEILLILLLIISLITLWFSFRQSNKTSFEGYGCDGDPDFLRMCGKGCNVAPSYATPSGWKCCYTSYGRGPSCIPQK